MEAMRKDGSSVFIELNSSPIIKGGEIIGIQGVMRDMTERKKAEEELQKSEQKYRGLSESLDELVYRADPKTFAATYVNVAVKKLYGYSVKEWLADPGLWENSIHPNDKERTLRELEDAQRKLKSAIVEYRIIRKDKSVRYVKDHVSWEKDNEGKAASMNGIMYDITDLKRFEQTICQSEEKYRTLVESTGDSIATVNEDGVFLYMNETGAKQLGGKPEDYIGKTMWNVFPKKIAARQVTNVQKVINTGEGMNTVALTELHGQQRWYSTNIEPLRDGSRKVTAAMIVARDIHELKQAEEEIRNLSSAIEQTIDGIAIGDLGSKLLYVNDAFAGMHGYTPEEMIGMPITRLYKKEQMGEYRRGMNRIKTQDFWEGEIKHVRKDGAAFPTHMSVTLLRNNGGKPKGILAVARDITESKRREMALNIYRKKMTRTEQLASIGTLSATLAHELTQPLTVVRLSIENSLAELEKTSCPDTVVEDLKEGLSEVSSIASTVNGFRNLARRSSETKVTEVDLKAITKRIVKLLDENARLVKVTLRIEGMDKLPVIYSHKHELERLFYCLVENAIQAADGKKSHQVIISGALRDKQVELRFSDNCSGIALENLNKIFEPFFTTKSSTERTGLGLCVVEHILSRLDGKVRVESKLGKGSTFFVTLPINGVEK
jgi:PAS domain S-box-containing protein